MRKLLVAIIATTFCLGASSAMAKGKYKTCKSFNTQKQAQSYYNQRKKSGLKGWKSLDRDKDGQACDCLPGGNGKHCPKKKK